MMKPLVFCFALFSSIFSTAQSIQELYEQRDFTAILGSVDTIANAPIEDVHLFARAAHALRRDSLSTSVLRQVVRTDRATATTKFELGRSYYGVGKFENAAKWFREARKSNPDMLLAYLAEADAYEMMRRLDSAVHVYQVTVDHFDDKGVALLKTCILPTEEGYVDSAIHCWERNLNVFEKPEIREMARQQLVTLYWEFAGDTLAAAILADELVELKPDVAKYRLQSIQIHSELGEWDEVERQLEELRSQAENGALNAFYMQRNAIPLMTVSGRNFDVQIFEIIEQRPDSEEFSARWSAYFTTPLHGRLLGHVRYYETGDTLEFKSNISAAELPQINSPLSIEDFVNHIKRIESNLH